MVETCCGRISHATYVRTIGRMLTRDWYALDACEVLTRLDLVTRLVAASPDRYPSKGWAVRVVLDKAIAGVIALCDARQDPASARLAQYLEARWHGRSVGAIAQERGLSREHVSRSVGRQAIVLVTDRVIVLNSRAVATAKSGPKEIADASEHPKVAKEETS
jgi:hypothetical protein